jgi:predicted CopG family antitoxin
LSAQLDQIIADAIASLSSKDGLSAQILGEFIGRDIYEAFKQGSETQLETVNRVVGSFEAISGAFDKLGLEIDEVGLDALDLTERMIKLAGGFEVLTTNLDAYYQNFYSEEERAANTMAELTEALESLGYGIPGTRAAFRGLVEELERAGNLEGFTTLINSNGSFAQFYAQMEQWTASLFETYRNTIGRDPSAMELYRWLDKLKTGEALFSDVVKSLTTGISDATANLSQQDIESLQSGAQDIYDAYQYTLEIAQEEHALALERIGQEENLLKSLRTLIDNLKLSDISPLTPAERLAEAQRQYASILAAVEGGDFSRAGELDSAAQAYLGEASSYYASSATYEGIFNNVLGSLESLEAQYGTSLSYEDRKEQLDNQLLATQDRAKSLLEDQLKALADSYQLDQSILSVLSLLPSELANAIAQVLPESLGGVGADYSDQSKFSLEGLSLDGIDSRIIDLYNNLLGRAPDAEGAYYWQQQMAGGMSIQEMTSHFLYEIERLGLLNGPGAANGISVPQVDQDAYDRYKNFANGSHFGGIESVPFDGYKAILHRGEKVIPASSAKDDEKLALITEIRALRAEVTQLREDQNRNAQRAEETAVVASNMSAQIISQSTKDAIESKSVADRAKVTMR